MNHSNAKIPGIYLYTLSECMKDFGISQQSWLQGSIYESIDSSIINESVNYQTLKILVLQAIELSQHKTLGILVGHRLSLQSHGILGYALMNCENLEAAAKLLEQYITLRFPLVQVSSQLRDGVFVIELTEKFPLEDIRDPIFETILVAIKSALDQIIPKLKKDLTLHLPSSYNHKSSYDSLKDCTLVFNSPFACVSVPQDLLKNKIPLANLAAYKEAEILCAKELSALSQEDTYKTKVKKKILENNENFPSQEVMASWFNMTSRTLHRRLVAENSSYREILEEAKQSLALSYLGNTDLSIKEIAYFLGYEDDRNFSRAFKRWQGMSPSQFRLQKLSQ